MMNIVITLGKSASRTKEESDILSRANTIIVQVKKYFLFISFINLSLLIIHNIFCVFNLLILDCKIWMEHHMEGFYPTDLQSQSHRFQPMREQFDYSEGS